MTLSHSQTAPGGTFPREWSIPCVSFMYAPTPPVNNTEVIFLQWLRAGGCLESRPDAPDRAGEKVRSTSWTYLPASGYTIYASPRPPSCLHGPRHDATLLRPRADRP